MKRLVLVGESGSGKSTTGRSIIRLYDPTDGTITFDGVEISGKLNEEAERHLRTNMQMIFQDPMASLNPRKKVLDLIAQGIRCPQALSIQKKSEMNWCLKC